MKNIIRVMVVEDHPEYREVIGFALKKETDMTLVSEFGTAERALRSLNDMTTRAEPNVILLDLNLPGMSGLDAVPFFKSAIPDAKIIVLTQSDKEDDVLRAIQLGASGYLLKSSTVARITIGIRNVMKEGTPIDAGVAKYILNRIKTAPKKETVSALTDRETEILSLIAEGLAKKEIADRLKIGTSTVVTHVSHIYEKLNVANAPSAVSKAYRRGILPQAG
jgi:DNA-binding NarL/FixJ family response regulator